MWGFTTLMNESFELNGRSIDFKAVWFFVINKLIKWDKNGNVLFIVHNAEHPA